jgi:hypothetical protein
MIERLRADGEGSAELQVEPDGLESSPENQAAPSRPTSGIEDSLVELFRQKSQVPMELFLAEMRQQRPMAEPK